MSDHVQIYDSTLRDGAQAEGIAFSLDDKLMIAQRLDELGVHYIEGGWPNPTNPKDLEFFNRISELPLENAKVAAFGSTRRANNHPEDDPILNTLLQAGTNVVTLFGKSWELHVTHVLRTTRDENLKLIRDSVAFIGSNGREGRLRRGTLLRRVQGRPELRRRHAAGPHRTAAPAFSSFATPTAAPCPRNCGKSSKT